LFQFAAKHYLVVADIYSLWPEVYLLKSLNTKSVVEALKQAFSHHGIPDEVISDNGPQYASAEFRKFASDFGFHHQTSSPHFPQSNGFAESMVKSVKSLIKKCTRSHQDMQRALLILRNSPLNCGQSPAQLLFGRSLQDNLPRFEKPKVTPRFTSLSNQRINSKVYHDQKCNTQLKPKFNIGQHVAIQHPTTKEWTDKGKIVELVAPRSYLIKFNSGTVLRRNQNALRPVYSLSASPEIKCFRDANSLQVDVENPETISNHSSDTIAYEEESSSDETVAYYLSDDEGNNDNGIEMNQQVSKYGRKIKKVQPIDYDDI